MRPRAPLWSASDQSKLVTAIWCFSTSCRRHQGSQKTGLDRERDERAQNAVGNPVEPLYSHPQKIAQHDCICGILFHRLESAAVKPVKRQRVTDDQRVRPQPDSRRELNRKDFRLFLHTFRYRFQFICGELRKSADERLHSHLNDRTPTIVDPVMPTTMPSPMKHRNSNLGIPGWNS
jgi:hypothetical protein